MLRAIASTRNCGQTPLAVAGRNLPTSSLPQFTPGAPGPGLFRPCSTFLSSGSGQGLSDRTGTPLSGFRVLSIQKRELHVGAAGALYAFKEKDQIQRLKEPTIVSTIYTRDQALKLNPELPKIEEALRSLGHSVAYEADLTQMHNKNNQGTLSLLEKAGKLGVDLTSVEISYLRSSTKTKPDDDTLIHDVTQSLRESGVKSLCVTHSLDMHNLQQYTAPSGSQWRDAATAAGFELVESREKPGSCDVESVLNEQGRVTLIRPFKSGESTFVSADPPQAGTGVAASIHTQADKDVLTRT